MKNNKILFCLLALFAFSHVAVAQKKKETVTIKTSAQCDMCKKRIEETVLSLSGVKSAALTVATSELKVVYLTAKTNVDAIRNTISMMGYDADQVKADHAAYHKLPPCCQKSGHQH